MTRLNGDRSEIRLVLAVGAALLLRVLLMAAMTGLVSQQASAGSAQPSPSGHGRRCSEHCACPRRRGGASARPVHWIGNVSGDAASAPSALRSSVIAASRSGLVPTPPRWLVTHSWVAVRTVARELRLTSSAGTPTATGFAMRHGRSSGPKPLRSRAAARPCVRSAACSHSSRSAPAAISRQRRPYAHDPRFHSSRLQRMNCRRRHMHPSRRTTPS